MPQPEVCFKNGYKLVKALLNTLTYVEYENVTSQIFKFLKLLDFWKEQ